VTVAQAPAAIRTDGPLELAVGGMTCGACAVRIERRLNRLDGVTATVSYATERAYVVADGGHDVAALVAAVEAAGYTAALVRDDEPPEQAAGRAGRRAAVCAPLALATIALAMIPAAQFTGWQWVSLLLAAPAATWGAWPLHQVAWRGLGHGTATMDTLVSLGVTASFGWSVYALLFGGAGAAGMKMPFAFAFGPAGGQMVYFEAAAGVTAAVLAGRWLEARAKDRSGAALATLAALGVRTATVLRDDGREEQVPAAALAVGDLMVVRPGERIPADGVVTGGRSAVDAALVTGEPIPADVGPGQEVTGATVNLTGRLTVRAARVGADTLHAQILRLATDALASKAAAQRIADRIAAVFVPCVVSLAVATLGFWLGAGLPAASAWSAAIAVLVVACPCSLGLATPAALLAALGRGAELGILVKNAQALETAGRIRTLLLDKTGTLTTGTMTVHAVTTAAGIPPDEALTLAGAVEHASAHPVGRAVAAAALARREALPPVTDFTSETGAGVRGTVSGHAVVVGRPDWVTGTAAWPGPDGAGGSGPGRRGAGPDRPREGTGTGRTLPGDLAAAVAQAVEAGWTAVVAGWDGEARAVFAVGDTIRPGAGPALARVRRLGLHLVVLTGDHERTARKVADGLGVPPGDVLAGVDPAGKVAAVRRHQEGGGRVAMAGDGVNDAAALAQADLGLALGTGSDAAIGAADLTLISGDPGALADAIELARATLRVIRVNLAWAFGYNLAAVPLAALGYLNPLFAGVAMSASSLIVVGNSLRLRRFRPRRDRGAGQSR